MISKMIGHSILSWTSEAKLCSIDTVCRTDLDSLLTYVGHSAQAAHTVQWCLHFWESVTYEYRYDDRYE